MGPRRNARILTDFFDGDDIVKMPVAEGSSEQAKPPPESRAFLWTRRLIIFAFWFVIITLGLPHWIWTTSIHRSDLPLELMNNWADGKVSDGYPSLRNDSNNVLQACQFHYPLYVRLILSDSETGRTNDIAAQVGDLLTAQNVSPLYEFHVILDGSNGTTASEGGPSVHLVDPEQPGYREAVLAVRVQADTKVKSTEASLRSWVPILDIRHNPGRSVDAATLGPFIASEIRKVFDNEKDSVSYLLSQSAFAARGQNDLLSPEVKAGLDAKSTRAFKYASTYHLTFSLFTSSASPSAWDVEQALDESIRPLLERMSSISRCTVDTQVQLYASFSPSIAGPQYDSSTREWKLQRSDLSGFINAAEWPLSPDIGSGPTINFVLYVPSKDQSPLVLAETGGNSWLVPQWGGVQILNPTGEQPDKLTAEDLRPAMLTFSEHLSSLLGVSQSPPSLSLRISSLTRERAMSLILSTSSTLGALARLTLKLTSIAIPNSVAKSVDETLHKLDQACQDLREGRYQIALENARIAEGEAEQAFFEPSMVGQVYFPDEHKVAVYVPLLGPMAVPLVMAAVKELKKLRLKKAKTA